MKNYLKSLKKNRSIKADQILKDFINKYDLRKKLLSEITLLQNRTRGNLFELMGELTVSDTYNIKDFETQKIFDTPWGKRKVDLFSSNEQLIIEIKSGYARSNSFTRKQIEKDKYIINNYKDVKKSIWILFRGGTKPLTKFLDKSNIEYLDVEYDMKEDSNENNKKILKDNKHH